MPRGSPRVRTQDGKINLVGQRVSIRRSELRIKQDELCARIATHTNGEWNPAWQDISRIENGSRIVSDIEIVILASALECAPAWLLTGK